MTRTTQLAEVVASATLAAMPEITKDQVAEMLEEIATMLELKGENVFKVRAYRNAARAIETFSGNLRLAATEQKLAELEGVGKAIAEKVGLFVTTGSLAYHTELKAEFPPGIFDMFGIPGMGPKKIHAVWHELNITAVTDLEAGCKDGRVAKLRGFGEKTAANILKGIEDRRKHAGRFRIGDIAADAEKMLDDRNPRCAGKAASRRTCAW